MEPYLNAVAMAKVGNSREKSRCALTRKNEIKTNAMHFYTMTITEETTKDLDPSTLQLWENRDGKIWIQVGYDEMEPGGMQGIPITVDDAKALIGELSRIVKSIEPGQSVAGKQLTLTSPLPNPSKVNWGR